MPWKFDKNKPICPQIEETLCAEIANGKLEPNQRLLSVRDVAIKAGVNPNTVQKAFTELEQMGLIYSVRGSGWFVSENTELAKERADQLKREKTKAFFSDMQTLGVSVDEIKKYVEEWEE